MKFTLKELLIVINTSYFQEQSKLEYTTLISTPFIVFFGSLIHNYVDYNSFEPILFFLFFLSIIFSIHFTLRYIVKKHAVKYAEIIAKHRSEFGMHKIGLIIFITLISIVIGWLLIGK